MAKYDEIKIGMKIGLWTVLEKTEPIIDKDGKKIRVTKASGSKLN